MVRDASSIYVGKKVLKGPIKLDNYFIKNM